MTLINRNRMWEILKEFPHGSFSSSVDIECCGKEAGKVWMVCLSANLAPKNK